MNLGPPQLIYLALIALNLGVVLAKHGEVKPHKTSLWTQLLNLAIVLPLLWWGGFFG